MARKELSCTTGKRIKIGDIVIYVGRIRVRKNGKREVHLQIKDLTQAVKRT